MTRLADWECRGSPLRHSHWCFRPAARSGRAARLPSARRTTVITSSTYGSPLAGLDGVRQAAVDVVLEQQQPDLSRPRRSCASTCCRMSRQ